MGAGPVSGFEHRNRASAAALALAGSVGVHAALLLAPGAPPRDTQSPGAAMTVVQVRIEAPVPAVEAPVAVAMPRPALARRAKEPDRVIEHAAPALPESAITAPATTPGEPASASDRAPAVAAAPKPESLAAIAASSPVAFLDAPQPDYPASAREDGQEGLVVLRVRVSKDGRAAEILIARGSGVRALDAAALAGVRRWTFRPARIAGEDVEAWMDVPIRFRLQ